MSDGFLHAKSLIVDIFSIPDGEDRVGSGALRQPGPGHLEHRNVDHCTVQCTVQCTVYNVYRGDFPQQDVHARYSLSDNILNNIFTYGLKSCRTVHSIIKYGIAILVQEYIRFFWLYKEKYPPLHIVSPSGPGTAE